MEIYVKEFEKRWMSGFINLGIETGRFEMELAANAGYTGALGYPVRKLWAKIEKEEIEFDRDWKKKITTTQGKKIAQELVMLAERARKEMEKAA